MAESENVTSPMPIVRAATAERKEPGFFIHSRTPNRRSFIFAISNLRLTKLQIPRRKHQSPNAKHQKISKPQTPVRRRRGRNWVLEIGISLVFGSWCLVFSNECLELPSGLVFGAFIGFGQPIQSSVCRRNSRAGL